MSTSWWLLILTMCTFVAVDDAAPWWLRMPASFTAGVCVIFVGDRIDQASGRKDSQRMVRR